MHGWFKNLFKSKVSLSTQSEQEAKVTSVSTSDSFTSSFSSLSSSPGITPQQPLPALSSPQRWIRKYDLLVCHSCADSDTEEAQRLVSFLEASPRSLRCFLWHRDVCLGGAVFTEFCQAVQDSHLQALLITPNFLQDEWCKYMMHQTLAEGPMSNRLIPLVQNLLYGQYPQELKFYFYIDLSRNTNRGYIRINETVLQYLKNLAQKEKTKDCNVDCSGNRLSGQASSQKDDLMLENVSTETSIMLEEMQRKDESKNDGC